MITYHQEDSDKEKTSDNINAYGFFFSMDYFRRKEAKEKGGSPGTNLFPDYADFKRIANLDDVDYMFVPEDEKEQFQEDMKYWYRDSVPAHAESDDADLPIQRTGVAPKKCRRRTNVC